eukprot:CAMPEP_0201506392 /NCGR_PEP_ID=MMETSP0161_2-20130828/305_1 /ASSEMBLY_ACC=CAM_ASM_000251 /TAXON_ID=180227 /ORGANISM="Neoparamoeba aestuarina, Strain SoJaBio B1-5/56/2" /LENGTH=380 /DNA_ID=CAMNT_0047900463 /DNA_START=82 /DNA_END=1224 /DNA_ORIENTATION=-
MALYVLTGSQEEQMKELFSFFQSLKEEQEKKEEAPQELVALLSLVVKDFAAAFKKAEPAQLEGAFNLFVSLVKQTEGEDKTKLYSSLVAEVCADQADRPLLRLKFLNNIFNAEQDGKIRFNAFLNICCLSLSSSSSALLVPQLPKLEGWVKAWGLDEKETKNLYKSVLACLKANEENQQKLYQFLLQMLKNLGDEDLEDEAVEAVVLSLKLVNVKDFDDIVDLKSVRELQGDKAPLVKLLDIFAKGTVSDFQAFEKENGDAFFNAHGLSSSDLLVKMRYLSIAALGSKNKNLPFADLVKELAVDEEEVELWVLDAVEKGYVDGKIDELAGVVNIRQAHLRLFGEDEWKQLQGDLARAEKNLNHVLNSIDKSLSSAPYVRK